MTRLDGEAWLNAPETLTVISALDAKRPGASRFVGGCVRNALMGRPIDDIDIATQLVPSDVIDALKAAGIRAIPTGIEHGTVTAICDSKPYEITTLRRDVETDGRRAVVAFSEDWAEDAARRDFRCNALYAEPDGTVHDPVGGGIEDALAGRVIFIGDADQRLREDYLRILRFFRFNAWYGAGIDSEGLAACERQSEGLRKIAAERIWKELHKLLSAPDPSEAVTAMEKSGVLSEILPEAASSQRLSALVPISSAAGLAPDPLLRLMALLTPTEETAATVSKRLRLSNADKDRLENWVGVSKAIGGNALSDRDLARAFYRHGKTGMLDYLVWRYPSDSGFSPAALRNLFDLAGSWNAPQFPLSGEDALAAGLSGPAIGEALRTVESEWIESDFTLARNVLLEKLQAFA